MQHVNVLLFSTLVVKTRLDLLIGAFFFLPGGGERIPVSALGLLLFAIRLTH